MSDELRNQIYNNLNQKETDELFEIWKTNDRAQWSDLAFEILGEILTKRTGKLLPQNDIILEHQKEENEDDGLEDWEAKLLDNQDQPEFYDTLEVLNLKDNINKVAKAVVIANIVFGIANFQFVQGMLLGYFPSIGEMPGILWSLLITAIAVGIDIVILYFPLKALAYILRILMEMEFNSRKVNS